MVPVLTAVGEVRATILEDTRGDEWSLLLATQGGLPPVREVALLGADGVDADAAAVLKWVQAGGQLEFTRRECQKAMEGRFRNVERLKKATERLEAQDVVKEGKRSNKGAPPTTFYRVNPKVHQ